MATGLVRFGKSKLRRWRARVEPALKHDAIVAGAALLIILVIFFNDALLPGRVLSPADAVFTTPAFADLAPEGFVEPSNELLFDQVYQFTPWRKFAWDSLRQGDLPLWNPYSGTGGPLAATMQAAVFYPINLALLIVPFTATFVLSALFRLWIAGFATYLLGRRLGLAPLPAFVPAVSFMLCGFLVAWLGHPHTNVAIWLPALMLAADSIATARERGRTLTWIGGFAIVLGVAITGGHVETAVDLIFGVSLYFALRLGQITLHHRDLAFAARRILALGVAGVLGAGIAAIQLMPFIEWLPLSAEYQRRSSDAFRWLDPVAFKNLVALPLAAFPNMYGNPSWSGDYWSFNPWGNFNESVLYAGIIPLALCIAALVGGWRRNPLVRLWGVLIIISLGMAMQVPPFDWINQLPGLALAHPNRLRLLVTFGVAMLAGFGAQALAEPRVRRTSAIVLALVTVAGGFMALAGGVLLPRSEPRVTSQLASWIQERYPAPESAPRSVMICRPDPARCVDDLSEAFRLSNIELYLPALVALIGLGALIYWSRRWHNNLRYLQAGIIALVIIDLIAAGHGINPTMDADDFYPEPSILAEIGRDDELGRFTVLGQAMYPDAQMLFDLADVRTLDFPTARLDVYLNASGDRTPWIDYGVLLGSFDSLLLAGLNIRYVVAADSALIEESDNLRRIGERNGIYLGEVIDPRPRAFMVYNAQIVQNDGEAVTKLTADPKAASTRLILQDSADARSALSMLDSEGAGEVHNLSYESAFSSWSVTTTEPGLLFVSDSYYPGWSAFIDDQPVPVMRANLNYRAISVPAGEHLVEFRYEPRSVQIGFAITGVSLLLAAGLIAYGWRARRNS